MRFRARPAWSNPCCPGIAEAARWVVLWLQMLLWIPSLALIDSWGQSGEASVDRDVFCGSYGVAGGIVMNRSIILCSSPCPDDYS